MCLRFLSAREALKTHGCFCELRGVLAALPLSGRNHSLWRSCVCAHPSLIKLFPHLRVHDLGRGSDRRRRIEVVPQALIHSNQKLCVVNTYSWWCDSRANLTDIGKISLSNLPPGSNAGFSQTDDVKSGCGVAPFPCIDEEPFLIKQYVN